jgi:hypothetical protein
MKHLKRFNEKFTSGMSLIKELTPEVEDKIEDIKNRFPNHKIEITSNDKWKPEDKYLKGTYTLSYSGPDDDNFNDAINSITKN